MGWGRPSTPPPPSGFLNCLSNADAVAEVCCFLGVRHCELGVCDLPSRLLT